jgi:hypothetical protein
VRRSPWLPRSLLAQAARVILAAAAFLPRPVAADTVLVLDGAVDLSYQTGGVPSPDNQQAAVQLRPGITFQTGTPRLTWRVSYLFVGSVGFYGPGASTYSNQLTIGLSGETSPRTFLAGSASVTQGGTAFQLTQVAADAGTPAFRVPSNPDLVNAGVGQLLAWEASAEVRLTESLNWAFSAPQYDLAQSSQQLTALVALDWVKERDSLGGELSPSVAWLRAYVPGMPLYMVTINQLVGRWSHDLGPNWTTQARAGAANVIAFTGSYPLSIVPVGSASVAYTGDRSGASLSLAYGPQTNLQTGTVTQSGTVLLRGFLSLDRERPRQLAASAGFMRSRPLGEVTPAMAIGTGDAVQGDVGFIWGLTDVLLVTARYSIAYQYMQPLGTPPSLAQVLLVGFTAHWSSEPTLQPLPSLGRRVDGTDSVGVGDGDARRKRSTSP